MKPTHVIAAVAAMAVIGVAGTYATANRNGPATIEAGNNSLTVRASGVRNGSGQIIVTLCSEGQKFPSACSGKSAAAAKPGETVVEFNNLASGKYAVALFHDENADGALTLQQEGIGFSRNANLEFSMPDFNKSAFSLPESNDVSINLKYYN